MVAEEDGALSGSWEVIFPKRLGILAETSKTFCGIFMAFPAIDMPIDFPIGQQQEDVNAIERFVVISAQDNLPSFLSHHVWRFTNQIIKMPVTKRCATSNPPENIKTNLTIFFPKFANLMRYSRSQMAGFMKLILNLPLYNPIMGNP